MTKDEWLEELAPLLVTCWKVDPVVAEHHPAYQGTKNRIDELVEIGISKDFTEGWEDGYVYGE